MKHSAENSANGTARNRKEMPMSNNMDDMEGSRPSNEYVLNFAFFSFFIFMLLQGFFAILARSQSMVSDSLAMSVDAFTYLFNLSAERLKRNPNFCCMSRSHSHEPMTIEERKRRRKLILLYLEFFPPLISVSALTVVSYCGLRESIRTLVTLSRGPMLAASYVSDELQDEDPNVMLMLCFSGLNLLLDILNVTCFAKTENFRITSLESCGLNFEKEFTGKEENEAVIRDDVKQGGDRIKENIPDVEEGNENKNDNFEGNEEQSRKVYPVATVSSNSSGSSHLSGSDEDIMYNESDTLLGISRPDYTSPEKEWDEDLSIGALYGGGDSIKSDTSSCGRNSYYSFTSSGLGGNENSSFLDKPQSPSNNSSNVIDWGDGLEGISEGEEEEEDSKEDDILSVDTSLEEVHPGLFNLNMCSAYTHVMADTLRSIAVFVAAGLAYTFSLNPLLADSTASIIVSIIIAISLGPLFLGLAKTVSEIWIVHRDGVIIEDKGETSTY